MLKSKREATRFQILVEIAAHQPSVRQQEIAAKMGVTPQAVSEYIREMVDDGFVNSNGRGRYNVTKKGVEWVTNTAETLDNYLKYVTTDVIQEVSVWTAIAKEPLAKGDTVGVFMKGGLLYAAKSEQTAMGEVTDAAKPGEDVGVAKLSVSSPSKRVLFVSVRCRVSSGEGHAVSLLTVCLTLLKIWIISVQSALKQRCS